MQHLRDRSSKSVRGVTHKDVLAVHYVETLAPDRRRHDGFPHRPRVQNLEARPSADTDRHSAATSVRERTPDIGDMAERRDAGLGAVSRLVRNGHAPDQLQ